MATCVAVTLVVLMSSALFAQANQGSIGGNVLDSTGALVANAKIVAKEVSTGTTYETVSSSAGSYRFPNVRNGVYNVTVSATGFKTAQLTGVVVNVGTTSGLDVTLQAGATSETVEVLADTPTVQTESVEVGTVVTTKQVLDLPLALGSVVQAMRSPEAFVFLTPGAVGPGTASGNGGTFESKISGGQNYATEVLLDGSSTARSENGSSFDETAPSVEALGEYKVFTSTLPAEMGRTTGGIESFNTRSGTNAYHGVLYEIFRNEALDANTFFNDFKGIPKNLDRQNDYGLTLGGPIRIPHLYNGKDKTFFFFSWEQYRKTQGGVTNYTVPTALQRQGNFSETLTANALGTNPCDGSTIFQGQIFDPTTTQPDGGGGQCRTAYPGNIIPSADFTGGIGEKLLSLYPAPQNGNLNNNFAFPFSFPILDTTTTVRLDHNLSAKSKLYGSYNSRDNVRTSTTIFFDTPQLNGRHQDFFTHYIRAGWDYSISPTMLNHLNVGYNRTNSKNVGAGVPEGVNWADQLGISGTRGDESAGSPFPIFRPVGEGLPDLGDDVNGDTIDNGFRFNDNLEWIKGKHDWKFGTDLRHQQYSPLDFSRTTGDYFFQRQQTAASTNPALDPNGQSGNALASELLGLVHDSNLLAHGPQPRYLSNYYSLYFQDTFKIRPTLTLTYGLRWEVDKPRRESGDNTSNIDLTAPNPGADGFPGALVFAGTGTGRNGVSGETWAKPFYKDFGPRVGFAWSPSFLHNKTVVRGGFGILYGFLLYADFGGFNRAGFTGNPGFSTTDNFGPAFKIDNGFPAFTPPPNLDPAQANFTGPQYVDPSFGRPPMINNWSIEVQHELASDLILDVAYVGQHSTHLRTNFDAQNSLHPNFLALGTLLSAQVGSPEAQAAGITLPFPSFPTTQSVAQALVPFPQYFGFNTDGALENYGQSSYNALQASVRRRFHNGLNLLASYTWSKTLTDADAGLPFFATLHGGGAVQNPFNLDGEKAISNQDVPHTLVLSYVYELPFGKGKKFASVGGWKDKVIGGWEVSGIQRYQSGQPLSFCCAGGIPGFQGAIRYNRVQGQSLFSDAWKNGTYDPTAQSQSMFNPAAFADPNACLGAGTCTGYSFGNMPRTTGEVRMPAFLSEDFNLLKRIHLTEGKNITFQFSFLDAFNRHEFNRPGDLNPADFRTPTIPVTNRFAIIDPNNTIMGPRVIQLQLKFEY